MESMYKEAYCINYRVWLHLPLRRLINLHGVLGCRGLCLQLKRPVWPTRSSWLHFWTASRVQASTIKGSEYITLKHWLWKELFWIGQGAALMRWAKWLPLCSGCLWQSWWVWVKAGGDKTVQTSAHLDRNRPTGQGFLKVIFLNEWLCSSMNIRT